MAVATIPGILVAIVWSDRAVGSASRTSSFNTRCCTTLCTSTVGLAPVTVSVSCTPPTFSSALTVAMNEAGSSMPSRLTV